MDRRKHRYITLIIILEIVLSPGAKGFADDFKKPLLQLPEINIVGEQDTEEIFSSSRPVPSNFNSDFNNEDKTTEESMGFVSGAYGRFESKLYELVQSWKTDKFYYATHININKSEGSRDNSEFTSYRSDFNFGMPFDDENEVFFDLRYFDKDMELPGRVDDQFIDEKRRNTNFEISGTLLHGFDDGALKLSPYFEQATLNDDIQRKDFKNRIIGMHAEFEVKENTLDIDLYQNRLIKYYDRAILDAKVRLKTMELRDRLLLMMGSNIFAQEEFGQRPAPYLELIFVENENSLHKLIITRDFVPIMFSSVYLEENYVEVNPVVLRPTRKSSVSYSLDKYISLQWRMNASVYLSQDKDIWALTDNDANGLYSPETIEEVNFSGVKISTEYTWSEAFSNFFSIDIRKADSKDPNFEFIPYEPKHKISTGLTYKFNKKYKLNFVGNYFGRRYYEPNSKQSSDPYFLLGSKLTCDLKDYLTFFVLVDNLLNDHYEVVRGYPNQSRNIFSGVTVKF